VHKLAELCVKRPVFATMLIVALMVVGTFSFFTLGVDLFPRSTYPPYRSPSAIRGIGRRGGNRYHQARGRRREYDQRNRGAALLPWRERPRS